MSTEHVQTRTRIGPQSECIEKRCMECGYTRSHGQGAPYDLRFDPEYSDFDPEDEDLPTPDVW